MIQEIVLILWVFLVTYLFQTTLAQFCEFRIYVFKRAQTEAVTFLGQQENSKSLYAIPGLDYVAHEDVLPYRTTEHQPLCHELFEKFLMPDPDKGCCFPVPIKVHSFIYQHVFVHPTWFINNLRSADPPFEARETLRAWQERNQPWLELSDVHKETTENIRVTVTPFYMGCRESQNSTVFWVRFVYSSHISWCWNLFFIHLCSGGTVSDSKIWENYLYNCENDTGVFSVFQEHLKQSEEEGSSAKY